jgi:ribosome silencing factor RsfS/YbeB/iojap
VDAGSTGSSMLGYSRFQDQDATIIYDVEEERRLRLEALEKGEILETDKRKKITYKYQDIAMTRGEEGVFDLHELVKVIKGEKMKDVAVIRIPKERVYADYFVIGTGRNARHIYVLSQMIHKLYKTKASTSDANASISGVLDKGSSGWMAMDLGNIVLHLFTQEKRDYYSLETLWTLGPEYDELSHVEEDPIEQLMAGNIPQEFLLSLEETEEHKSDFKQLDVLNLEHNSAEDNLTNTSDSQRYEQVVVEATTTTTTTYEEVVSHTISGRNKDGRTLA